MLLYRPLYRVHAVHHKIAFQPGQNVPAASLVACPWVLYYPPCTLRLMSIYQCHSRNIVVICPYLFYPIVPLLSTLTPAARESSLLNYPHWIFSCADLLREVNQCQIMPCPDPTSGNSVTSSLSSL